MHERKRGVLVAMSCRFAVDLVSIKERKRAPEDEIPRGPTEAVFRWHDHLREELLEEEAKME